MERAEIGPECGQGARAGKSPSPDPSRGIGFAAVIGRPTAVRAAQAKTRSTSRSASASSGPRVSGAWPGRTRWMVCRPARRVCRSLATVRSARLVPAGRLGLADQLGGVGPRQQLEPDEVDAGRPVADRADDLGRRPAADDQRLDSGVELAVEGSGSKSETAIARNATSIGRRPEDALEGRGIIGHGPLRQRDEVEPVADRQPLAPEPVQPRHARRAGSAASRSNAAWR